MTTQKLSNMYPYRKRLCSLRVCIVLAALITISGSKVSLNAATWWNRIVDVVDGTLVDISPAYGYESGLTTERLQWGVPFSDSFASYVKWEGYKSLGSGLGQWVEPRDKFWAGHLTFGNGTVATYSSASDLVVSLEVRVAGLEFYIDNHWFDVYQTWKVAIVQTPNLGNDPVADADYLYFPDFPWLGSFRVFEGRSTRVPVLARFGSVIPAGFGEVEDPSAGVVVPSVVPDPDDPGMNRLPDCSNARPSTTVLWPPDHSFVEVEILGVVDPDDDLVTINIDGIFQDEPVNGYGDGDLAPDGDGIGTATALLRAERTGAKKVSTGGRVYHIQFTATDSVGGACSGEVLVTVPHENGGVTVDEGANYDSTKQE